MIEKTLINNLAISIILTVIIEYIVIKALFLKKEKTISAVILANVLTNPIVVYLYNISYLIGFSIYATYILLILLELLAIFIEAYVYSEILILEKRKSIIISSIANIIAVILGILIL